MGCSSTLRNLQPTRIGMHLSVARARTKGLAISQQADRQARSGASQERQTGNRDSRPQSFGDRFPQATDEPKKLMRGRGQYRRVDDRSSGFACRSHPKVFIRNGLPNIGRQKLVALFPRCDVLPKLHAMPIRELPDRQFRIARIATRKFNSLAKLSINLNC